MIPFIGRRVTEQNMWNVLPNWQGVGMGTDAAVVPVISSLKILIST